MIFLHHVSEFLTVLLVHLLDFPDVHSMTDDIVVKLTAMRYGCQLRTWEMAKRVEIKTIEALDRKVGTTEADEQEPHFAILITKVISNKPQKLFV